MTTMLTRSVIDNRILRETGQLDTTLGASAGAVFEAPTLTGLLSSGLSGPNILDGFTEEQRIARRDEEMERWRENDRLQSELLSTQDPNRRDEINARLDALQDESQTQLDQLTRDSIAADRMQPQEALQEQYGDLGLTFDRAMTQEEADYIAANKREEITRNAIIEAGPKGVFPGVVKFGAGMAAIAVDPLEVASMFIPVVGQAGKAMAVSKLGRIGGRAAVGLTEGLVGNAITEPLYFGLSAQQQLDYTMSDALTNIGLGALLGGAFGGAIGAVSRADVRAPRIDPAVSAQAADIALRQFSTGKTVNISRILDGTDLRSTTALSRVAGIDFQAERVVELPVGQNSLDLRPTIIEATQGKPRVFDTIQEAEAFAEKSGGKAAMSGDGFVVRRPIDGEIVRDPFGKPLTFNNQRKAEKFISSARALPEGAKPARINVNGKPQFTVVHGMDAKSIKALEEGAETAEIPDGVNTRETAILPDANSRLDEAVRRTFAEVQIAKQFAADAENIELDPQVNLEASVRADAVLPETFVGDTLEEMDAAIRGLDEAGELSPEMKSELEAINKIDEQARAYTEVTQAATTCLLRA